MVATDRTLALALSDRLRFAFDDIREKLMPTAKAGEVEELLRANARGKTAQSYIRSSINHLAAISEMLEARGDEVPMDAEDLGNLIAIESAVNTLSDKLLK